MKNMMNKFRAIWKIIRSDEYFLYCDCGVCASHKKENTHSLIIFFCNAVKKAKQTK